MSGLFSFCPSEYVGIHGFTIRPVDWFPSVWSYARFHCVFPLICRRPSYIRWYTAYTTTNYTKHCEKKRKENIYIYIIVIDLVTFSLFCMDTPQHLRWQRQIVKALEPDNVLCWWVVVYCTLVTSFTHSGRVTPLLLVVPLNSAQVYTTVPRVHSVATVYSVQRIHCCCMRK